MKLSHKKILNLQSLEDSLLAIKMANKQGYMKSSIASSQQDLSSMFIKADLESEDLLSSREVMKDNEPLGMFARLS